MDKWLGKISHAEFGFGGYDDAMFGLSITITGDGSGVGDFDGTWKRRPDGAKWAEDDWDKKMASVCRKLREVLDDAKVKNVQQLVGIPVEVTMEKAFGPLKSWRVLTEVL